MVKVVWPPCDVRGAWNDSIGKVTLGILLAESDNQVHVLSDMKPENYGINIPQNQVTCTDVI
jgi:hypothetical protein